MEKRLPAEMIVPEAKEYISETIDDPEAIYDPEIWEIKDAASSHLSSVRTPSNI
jgi:hypothetical protein